jgi:hypothetical protein
MKLSSVEQAEQAEQARNLLLNELQEHQIPISLQELELKSANNQLSHRSLKEAAWRLVEEGKAQFNSTWDLEIL